MNRDGVVGVVGVVGGEKIFGVVGEVGEDGVVHSPNSESTENSESFFTPPNSSSTPNPPTRLHQLVLTTPVRTLSGGETFATSLSMALALSEKLSMGVELGILFLDEGFGTLDADTLESVTQILESLRQQDRLIGVITHVRALGERLPTQVKVHKSPEGSRLLVEAL